MLEAIHFAILVILEDITDVFSPAKMLGFRHIINYVSAFTVYEGTSQVHLVFETRDSW